MYYEVPLSLPEAEAEADGILIQAEAVLDAPSPALPCKVRDASEIPAMELVQIAVDHRAACAFKTREGGEVHAPPPPRNWKRHRPGVTPSNFGNASAGIPVDNVIPFPPPATEIEPIRIETEGYETLNDPKPAA